MISGLLMTVYVTAALGLAAYGLNSYVMVVLFLRKRTKALDARNAVRAAFDPESVDLPMVTTQIPLYNEYNVVERVVRAVAAMAYPQEKHQIQILDDSDDETRDLVSAMVATYTAKGFRMSCVRRETRTGYKAGALQAGLESADGEYVAIFDADFVPPDDFFLKTLPFFLHDENLGLVQCRWGHLNEQVSRLTKAQALGIDGHFMVEQAARNFSGLFMNFNGTAGVFRKKALTDAGGWHWDTLTEDMDVSYRMQLAGWTALYMPDLVVPGEIPEDIRSFKSQQFRWAKGSMETALKLMPAVLQSKTPLFQKIQAFFHMTHYMIHPLMLLVAVLALPVILTTRHDLPAGVFGVLSLILFFTVSAPTVLYMTARSVLGKGPIRTLKIIPWLMIAGTGIALSNSKAVMEAFLGIRSGFIRTPKKGDIPRKTYAAMLPLSSVFELILGSYCLFSFLVYLERGRYLVGPFLALYAAGFLLTGMMTVRQTLEKKRP